jgi:SAM-dependent methyltransferase
LNKNWFEIWFSNKFYLELYKHRDDKDAQNLINLIQRTINLPPGSKILDVCCGAGRHSLEFARRGFNVTGFDLSDYLIKQAKELLSKTKEKNLKVKFLIKDMRNFNFNKSFDIAVNIFTSFGYFDTDDENFSLFHNVSDSLNKNGYFVFDFLNSFYLRNNLKRTSKSVINNHIVIQKRRIENDFVIKDILIKLDSKELKYTEKLKLYSLKDFERIFKRYNLKIYKVFGDYFGNDFDINKSSRLLIYAKNN